MQRTAFDREAQMDSGFYRLGWPADPHATLYCRYAVTVKNSTGDADAYTIEAICDLDGDGEQMAFGWVKPAPGERVGVPGAFGYCSVRGVLSGRGASDAGRLLDQHGPCDVTSAMSHF